MTDTQKGAASLDDRPLLTKEFMLLIGAGMLSMLGFATTIPLVPRFVEGPLDGGKVAVGVAVGIYAITGIVARPFVGRLGDVRGRRFLIVSGCVATGVIVAAHGLATSFGILVGIRLLMGATQGAFFVGTATLVSDLAPPSRRGEAINYFSVAVYGGLAFGPLLGELINDAYGFRWAFLIGGSAQILGGLAALGLPSRVPQSSADGGPPADESTGWARLIYFPAIAPGLVMMLGLIAFTALNAFLPLYVDEEGLGSAGAVLLVYGLVVVVMRVLGSKLVDRWGTRFATTVALLGLAGGMVLMGAWESRVGLFAAALILATGGSFLYPALFSAAVNRAPENIRARATSTFTMFFEAASGIAGPILGVAAALGGTRWAFYTAAISAGLGVPLLYAWGRRQPGAMIPAQAGR